MVYYSKLHHLVDEQLHELLLSRCRVCARNLGRIHIAHRAAQQDLYL